MGTMMALRAHARGGPEQLVGLLREGGRLVTLGAAPDQELAGRYKVHAMFFVVKPDASELAKLAEMADTGRLRGVISQTFRWPKSDRPSKAAEGPAVRARRSLSSADLPAMPADQHPVIVIEEEHPLQVPPATAPPAYRPYAAASSSVRNSTGIDRKVRPGNRRITRSGQSDTRFRPVAPTCIGTASGVNKRPTAP